MKILKFGFFAFMVVFALQYANAQYINAGDDDEVLFPVGNKKGKDGALFKRTDSDEVKIQKVLAYCDSQRQYMIAAGVSPCVESRSLSEFLDDVIANSPSLRNNVYREYLKMKPGLSGQIIFFVTVAASGEVTDIRIDSSTTDYPEFDNAVKDAVAAWKWKPLKKWRLKVLHPENNGDYTGMVWLRFKEEMLK